MVTPTDLSYPPGNVLRYGAVTGGTPCADAFQDAIDAMAFAGLPVIVPKGVFLVEKQLLRASQDVQHGLRIIGAGSRHTVIRSSVSYVSALRLVKTDTSDFDWGAEISGLTLRGAGGMDARGLEIVGQWHMKLDDVVIELFTKDGIWVPNRTDLSPTSDPWSSAYLAARSLIVQNNGGWGLLDEGQLALSGVFTNCAINSNSGGGVSTGTAALTWLNSSISYNGAGGSNGGLLVTHNGFTPFNLRFIGCEFDSNYNYNERIEAGARIVFEDCRDLSTESGSQRPATQTQITGTAGVCIDLKFVRPVRRSSGTAALTWFDLGNSGNVGDVDILDLQDIGNTTNLTRIANQGASTTCAFTEYAGLVRRARLRRYHLKLFVSANQAIPTGAITKVAYDTIDAPPGRYGQSAANADFSAASSSWTAPFEGRVSLRGYVTMQSAWGGMGTLRAYVNGSQAAATRVSCQTADAEAHFPIIFDLDVAAGDVLDIRADHAAGVSRNVIGGSIQGFWSIEYTASS